MGFRVPADPSEAGLSRNRILWPQADGAQWASWLWLDVPIQAQGSVACPAIPIG